MEWKIEKHQIRYEEAGKVLAEITFPYYIEEEKVYEFDHTFVDPLSEDRGLQEPWWKKLLQRLRDRAEKFFPPAPM